MPKKRDLSRKAKGLIDKTCNMFSLSQLAWLESALDHTMLMPACVSLEWQWLYVPQRLCDLLAFAREELVGEQVEKTTHRDDFAKDQDLCHKLIRKEIKAFDLKMRYVAKSGKTVPVYLTRKIVGDNVGQLFFMTYVRTLTRKEAERGKCFDECKFSVEDYKCIFDSNPSPTLNINLSGKIIDCNHAMAQVSGQMKSQMISTSVGAYFSGKALKYILENQYILKKGLPTSAIFESVNIIGSQGPFLFMRIDKIPYFDNKGEISGYHVILHDLTYQVVSSNKELAAIINDKLLDRLTKRELELCTLMSYGLNDQKICEMMGITIHTFNTHLRNIYLKLRVNSRTQLLVTMHFKGRDSELNPENSL